MNDVPEDDGIKAAVDVARGLTSLFFTFCVTAALLSFTLRSFGRDEVLRRSISKIEMSLPDALLEPSSTSTVDKEIKCGFKVEQTDNIVSSLDASSTSMLHFDDCPNVLNPFKAPKHPTLLEWTQHIQSHPGYMIDKSLPLPFQAPAVCQGGFQAGDATLSVEQHAATHREDNTFIVLIPAKLPCPGPEKDELHEIKIEYPAKALDLAVARQNAALIERLASSEQLNSPLEDVKKATESSAPQSLEVFGIPLKFADIEGIMHPLLLLFSLYMAIHFIRIRSFIGQTIPAAIKTIPWIPLFPRTLHFMLFLAGLLVAPVLASRPDLVEWIAGMAERDSPLDGWAVFFGVTTGVVAAGSALYALYPLRTNIYGAQEK